MRAAAAAAVAELNKMKASVGLGPDDPDDEVVFLLVAKSQAERDAQRGAR